MILVGAATGLRNLTSLIPREAPPSAAARMAGFSRSRLATSASPLGGNGYAGLGRLSSAPLASRTRSPSTSPRRLSLNQQILILSSVKAPSPYPCHSG